MPSNTTRFLTLKLLFKGSLVESFPNLFKGNELFLLSWICFKNVFGLLFKLLLVNLISIADLHPSLFSLVKKTCFDVFIPNARTLKTGTLLKFLVFKQNQAQLFVSFAVYLFNKENSCFLSAWVIVCSMYGLELLKCLRLAMQLSYNKSIKTRPKICHTNFDVFVLLYCISNVEYVSHKNACTELFKCSW